MTITDQLNRKIQIPPGSTWEYLYVHHAALLQELTNNNEVAYKIWNDYLETLTNSDSHDLIRIYSNWNLFYVISAKDAPEAERLEAKLYNDAAAAGVWTIVRSRLGHLYNEHFRNKDTTAASSVLEERLKLVTSGKMNRFDSLELTSIWYDYHNLNGNLDSCLIWLRVALKHAHSSYAIANRNYKISIVHQRIGKYPDSVLYYARKCLEFSESSGFKYNLGIHYDWLHKLLKDRGEYEEALEYYV